MQTLRLIIDPDHSAQNEVHIGRAAGILRAGGVVAFPTETVYGLGAHALDAAAVQKIFAAKQRPSWDPLIVHVNSQEMLKGVVRTVPELIQQAMARFWPGPLTLLLERSHTVPDAVTAGRPKVAVRMPAHPVALALIAQSGLPLAAPSANLFGRPSPTTAGHVLADLDGRIDAILDAGPTQVGLESTVVDPLEEPPVIYRAGAISREQLQEIFGEVRYYRPSPQQKPTSAPEALPSPGTGIRHYAPTAKLVLVEPSALAESVRALCGQGKKVGIMLPREARTEPGVAAVYDWGSLQDAEKLAHNLFAGLRWLDERKVDVIVCPVPQGEGGLFPAIRDRLDKAARES